MCRFLLGILLGLLLSVVARPFWNLTLVYGQAKGSSSGSTQTARILSEGVLSGWSQMIVLVHSGQIVAGLTCRDPQVVLKDKAVECSTESVFAQRPVVIGPEGSLLGWRVSVAGDQDFSCSAPTVSSESFLIQCPAQTELTTLQLQLTQSRADLARLKDQISRPAPWTINVASAPPHGFACPAGFIALEDNMLTCPAVIPLF